MKVLTMDDSPICVSDNVDLLIKRKKEIIDRLKNNDALIVFVVEENIIKYHTGISYVTNCFAIYDIEVLN